MLIAPDDGGTTPAEAGPHESSRCGRLVEVMALRPAITADTAECDAGVPPTEEIATCVVPRRAIKVPGTVTGPQRAAHARQGRSQEKNTDPIASTSPPFRASAVEFEAQNERKSESGAYRLRGPRHKGLSRIRSCAALCSRAPLSRAPAAVRG